MEMSPAEQERVPELRVGVMRLARRMRNERPDDALTTQEFGANAQTYGILASVMAIGSLSGSLLAARRRGSSVRLVFVSAALLGAATVLSGLMPTTWAFGIALLLSGIAALTMMTGANSYLQVNSGGEYRGRMA